MTLMQEKISKIRVATFNVYYAKNPGRIAAAIKENENLAGADVILLQEIEAHYTEAKARAQEIADLLGLYCLYAPARDVRSRTEILGTHGLAILTRFPIVSSEVLALKEYNLRYNSRKRIALNAVLNINGKLIQICNVHLDLRLNIDDRIAQAAEIIKNLNAHQIQKIIVGGDFNTVPIYWAGRMLPIFYARQKSKFNAFMHSRGFQTRLADIGYTMRQKLVRFSLDSIYTRGLDVSAFGIERQVEVSDHKPVWVDIEI